MTQPRRWGPSYLASTPLVPSLRDRLPNTCNGTVTIPSNHKDLLAEGVGFEPTGLAPDGFQDRSVQPLRHPSVVASGGPRWVETTAWQPCEA